MMLHCQKEVSLATLNTFGVAAKARVLWRLEHEADLAPLREALQSGSSRPLPLVLGGGSNLLLTGDLDEPVIQVALRGRRIVSETPETVVIEAAAGEAWDGLVDWTLAQGLCGLENLALIPGSVGAAPIQNIGAYGVEQCERFESLTAFDLTTGVMRRFEAAACQFGYRRSFFKSAEGSRWLVTSVRYRLSRRPAPRLGYQALAEALQARGLTAPTADEIAQTVRTIRRSKLPDPQVLGNAGSFFENPILPPDQAQALQAHHPSLPHWPTAEGQVKVSAAWMIDQCGWKGFREGDAGVHAQHALVLVNYGSASGADLLALARRISASVEGRFGVRLRPEPVIAGPLRWTSAHPVP